MMDAATLVVSVPKPTTEEEDYPKLDYLEPLMKSS